MDNNEMILMSKETIEKISVRLNGLRLMASEKEVKMEIESILKVLTDAIDAQNLSFKELLQEKIRETKHENPELNFKLYMLHRKLEDGKISEEEALKTYELYVNGHIG